MLTSEDSGSVYVLGSRPTTILRVDPLTEPDWVSHPGPIVLDGLRTARRPGTTQACGRGWAESGE